MAKTQDKDQKHQEKDQKPQEKEKNQKRTLVGRIKKVVKKSRRKLGEAKFEKELQRTIVFLEQLQATLGNSHAKNSSAPSKVTAKPAKKPVAKPLPAASSSLALKSPAPKPAVKAAKKVVSSIKK